MKKVILVISSMICSSAFALNCDRPWHQESIEFLQCTFKCKPGPECDKFARSLQRDSKSSCRPHPNKVWQANKSFPWLQENMKQVRGKVYYAGVVPGQYGYWFYSRKGRLVLHTTVHFENFHELSASEQKGLQTRFNQAAKIWEANNPFSFPVKFVFQIVEEPKRAHVRNITLKEKTRGPYFESWNINWSIHTIAHEFGHVLGLDDEYPYAGGKLENHCEPSSFMCKSNGPGTEIKNFHFYLVNRRLYCS